MGNGTVKTLRLIVGFWAVFLYLSLAPAEEPKFDDPRRRWTGDELTHPEKIAQELCRVYKNLQLLKNQKKKPGYREPKEKNWLKLQEAIDNYEVVLRTGRPEYLSLTRKQWTPKMCDSTGAND